MTKLCSGKELKAIMLIVLQVMEKLGILASTKKI